MRARALLAPVFLSSLPPQTGRCAPPRPSQLRCFLFDLQKYIKSTKYLRSILCTGATICPNFCRFFLFYIVFWSFLFDILFLFFSPFYLFSLISFSSYLFLFFLFFTYYSLSSYSSFFIFESVCCITDMHINYKNVFQFLKNRCLWKKIFIFKLAKHISVILRFFWGDHAYFDLFGVKVYTGATILFFSSYLFLFFSSYLSLFFSYYILLLLILIFLYLNCLLYYRHAF